MESYISADKKLILSQIYSKFRKKQLNIYLSYIFEELCCHQETQKYLSLQTFTRYLNIPLFISEILFDLSDPVEPQKVLLENFSKIMHSAFVFNVSNHEVIQKVSFIKNFFSFMSKKENFIVINDITLIFYHFHMLTNTNTKNISIIDTVVSDFSTIDDEKHKELTFEQFDSQIKLHSDIFYLFYFFLNYYSPIREDEITYLLKNVNNQSLKENIEDAEKETRLEGQFPLSSPSSNLFDYLNGEFKLNLVNSGEGEDNELKELNSFSVDWEYFKENQKTYSCFSKIENVILTKRHFIFPNKNRIFPLNQSFYQRVEDNCNLILYLCNDEDVTITFNNEESVNLFIQKYKEYTNYTAFEDKYELMENISQGEYGIIIQCRLKAPVNPEQTCVAKTIFKAANKNYHWELYVSRFLSKARVDGTVRYFDCYETLDKVIIVSEFIENGSLNDYLFSSLELLTSEIINKILTNVMQAIVNLNKYGIVHRDIKPDNILVTGDLEVKLIDFGFSRVIATNQKCDEKCGTICFASPEILSRNRYNYKTDFWSIGVIAYYLQFGMLPFDDEKDDIQKIIDNVVSVNYYLPPEDEVENYCLLAYDMIKMLLKTEDERGDVTFFLH